MTREKKKLKSMEKGVQKLLGARLKNNSKSLAIFIVEAILEFA